MNSKTIILLLTISVAAITIVRASPLPTDDVQAASEHSEHGEEEQYEPGHVHDANRECHPIKEKVVKGFQAIKDAFKGAYKSVKNVVVNAKDSIKKGYEEHKRKHEEKRRQYENDKDPAINHDGYPGSSDSGSEKPSKNPYDDFGSNQNGGQGSFANPTGSGGQGSFGGQSGSDFASPGSQGGPTSSSGGFPGEQGSLGGQSGSNPGSPLQFGSQGGSTGDYGSSSGQNENTNTGPKQYSPNGILGTTDGKPTTAQSGLSDADLSSIFGQNTNTGSSNTVQGAQSSISEGTINGKSDQQYNNGGFESGSGGLLLGGGQGGIQSGSVGKQDDTSVSNQVQRDESPLGFQLGQDSGSLFGGGQGGIQDGSVGDSGGSQPSIEDVMSQAGVGSLNPRTFRHGRP